MVFDITVAFGAPSTIYLQLFYKSTMGINGTFTSRNCSLQEAIIRYPVRVDNGIVTLQPMPVSENRTEYLVYRAFETTSFWSRFSDYS